MSYSLAGFGGGIFALQLRRAGKKLYNTGNIAANRFADGQTPGAHRGV